MKTAFPFKTKLVPKAQFLSGNIARKLRHTKAAAGFDPRFQANIPLLEEALPPRIPIQEIDIRLGMHWLPTHLIQRFALDVLKVWTTIRFNDVADIWVIEADGSDTSNENHNVYGVQWGERENRMTGVDLMQLSLNMKVPTVRRVFARDERPRIDPVLTTSARQKQAQLQQAFVNWVKDDPVRAEEVENRYNLLFNAVRLMVYDGSHLPLTGMSAEWQAKMRARSYQLDDTWRCLSSPYNTGLWLEPGLGKTQVLIATAMTAIQFGKAHKVLIVVQRKTLPQFRDMIPAMYPGARTMIATPGDCSKDRMTLFVARAMNSDAEIIVLTHQMFERLSLRPETWEALVIEQLTAITQQIELSNPERRTRGQTYDMKRLIRREHTLKERLKELREKHTAGLCLEDMGCDLLLVDEAHRYKRQTVSSKQHNVSGIPSGHSGCADFFRAVRMWMRKTYGTSSIVKATGTPINNSVVEAFIELWDLMPQVMTAMGLDHLDSCIAQFGDIKREPEVKPNGTVALTTRLSDFQNVPELKRLLFEAATVRTAEEVNLPLPKARFINVTAPMSPDQISYMGYLLHRTQLIKAQSPMEWHRPATAAEIRKDKAERKLNAETGEYEYIRTIVDNNLLVSTHGREACLHYRVRDPQARDFKYNKVYKCARRIYNIWKRTREGKATQLVFLNMSTPNNEEFSVYRELKGLLVTMGMPADQCVFIQDYESEDEMQDLFDKMNAGELSVLIGGEQMGVGLNVQKRAIAAHVLSLPWRPDTFEQFIKRVIRYDNLNEWVRIYTYGTTGVKGSTGFDPFILGHLKRKHKMRTSLLSKDMTVRRLEEETESPAFSYAQLEALLTGDDRIMELCKFETDLEVKRQLLRAAEQDVHRMKNDRWGGQGTPWLEAEIEHLNRRLQYLTPDTELALQHIEQGLTAENFLVTIQDQELTNPLDAAKAFAELGAQMLAENYLNQWVGIGTYGGFDICISASDGRQIFMELRGEVENWRVRFTQNPYTFANDRRLQAAYDGILDKRHEIQRDIERNTQKLAGMRQNLEMQEAQMISLRVEVQALELGIAQLRKELGCNEAEVNADVDLSTVDVEASDD